MAYVITWPGKRERERLPSACIVCDYKCHSCSDSSLSASPPVRTVILAQSTDSGQLISAAVIKLFHAMKLQVQDLRGVGIQVQLLEGNHSAPHDSTGLRTRSIKDMLLGQGSSNRGVCKVFVHQLLYLLLSVNSK